MQRPSSLSSITFFSPRVDLQVPYPLPLPQPLLPLSPSTSERRQRCVWASWQSWYGTSFGHSLVMADTERKRTRTRYLLERRVYVHTPHIHMHPPVSVSRLLRDVFDKPLAFFPFGRESSFFLLPLRPVFLYCSTFSSSLYSYSSSPPPSLAPPRDGLTRCLDFDFKPSFPALPL